jgi:gluconokinase
MKKALILTLDMGTSSVRAMLFDTRGRALPGAEVQSVYAKTTTADGGVETDAEKLLALTVDCLKQLLRKTDQETRGRVAGVGLSCFWHSLVGVGENGKAVTPLFSWADTRALAQAEKLKSEMDAKAYHKRTGCVLHPCYWPAKLRWLQELQPEQFGKARMWMSFGEYLQLRLFGSVTCSLSMASGTGLLNQNTKEWDPQTLTDLPIALHQLNTLEDKAAPSGLGKEWAKTLAPLRDLPWFPASGDGACSNIGSGAVDAGRIAINVGTSGAIRVAIKADHLDIPDELFCYRVDGERFLVGGAFANGGNAYAWAQRTLQVGDRKAAGKAVAALPPDGHGLTVLPFWAGERSPGWHAGARAAILGMNLHTTPAEMLRASLEAVAYQFANVYDILIQQYPSATQIVASGGAIVGDPDWAQMMADSMGVPITASRVGEATSRGAGLLALSALGHIKDLDAVPAFLWKTYTPDPARHAVYTKARARQAALYAEMLDKTSSSA